MSLGDLIGIILFIGFIFIGCIIYLYFTVVIPQENRCSELKNQYKYADNLTKKEIDFLIDKC